MTYKAWYINDRIVISCSCCVPDSPSREYLPAFPRFPHTSNTQTLRCTGPWQCRETESTQRIGRATQATYDPSLTGLFCVCKCSNFSGESSLTAGRQGAIVPSTAIFDLTHVGEWSGGDAFGKRKECFYVIIWTSTGRTKHPLFRAVQVGRSTDASEGHTESRHRRPSRG